MNAPVVIRKPIEGPSPIDEIAGLCLQMLLAAADKKNVALRAVIRLAGNALAEIEGHDSTAGVLATQSRHHAEARMNAARSQMVRRG